LSKNIPNYVDDNDKLRKFDGIKYCDFHYHGITIIAIYCPTLSDTCAKFLEWGCTKEVYTIAGQCQALQSNFQIVHSGHCPAQVQLHSRNLVKCGTLSGTSAAPIWIFGLCCTLSGANPESAGHRPAQVQIKQKF